MKIHRASLVGTKTKAYGTQYPLSCYVIAPRNAYWLRSGPGWTLQVSWVR